MASALLAAIAIALAAAGSHAQPQFADAYGNGVRRLGRKASSGNGGRRGAPAAARSIFLKGHDADPRAPSLIGSMSKPITGVCIATLIRDGKLAFTTPLRDALAGFFRRHGPPADRRLESVTIEQLLTHRSGLAGNDDDDPMQDIWRRRAAQGLAHVASPEPLLAEHFKHPLAYDARHAQLLHATPASSC